MDDLLLKICTGLIVSSIGGLVKLYSDHRVLVARHDSVQAELNELKQSIKEDANDQWDRIDKRFEKVETLIERLFTFEREDHMRTRDR